MRGGPELLTLLDALVRIPSVNPSLAPEEATGEGAIAEYIRDWLVERGVPAVLDDVAPGRPNVVGTVGRAGGAGGGPGKVLVLCAHIDTVGTAGMSIPPFEPRREGDRLYGRGSFDMKGAWPR